MIEMTPWTLESHKIPLYMLHARTHVPHLVVACSDVLHILNEV